MPSSLYQRLTKIIDCPFGPVATRYETAKPSTSRFVGRALHHEYFAIALHSWWWIFAIMALAQLSKIDGGVHSFKKRNWLKMICLGRFPIREFFLDRQAAYRKVINIDA